MGSGGVPSGGVTVIICKGRSAGLERIGKPNSRIDLYVDGKKKQSRWYDWEGKPIRNRDYFHGGESSHDFPHDHIWEWKNGKWQRNTDWEDPDYINFPEDNNG